MNKDGIRENGLAAEGSICPSDATRVGKLAVAKVSRRLVVAGVLVCVLVVGCAALIICHVRTQNQVMNTRNEITKVADLVALEALFSPDQRLLALPEGDVRALYDWLMTRHYPTYYMDLWGYPFIVRHEEKTLRDLWGHELIYHFPALYRKEAMFELYSVGPNGRDEQGLGDDVACGKAADWSTRSTAFQGGVIDLEWVRAHIHELHRDPKGGKIVASPPAPDRD